MIITVLILEMLINQRALLLNGFKETFHGIKVKPGHPTMFGKIGDTYIIALAGNPLAAILIS